MTRSSMTIASTRVISRSSAKSVSDTPRNSPSSFSAVAIAALSVRRTVVVYAADGSANMLHKSDRHNRKDRTFFIFCPFLLVFRLPMLEYSVAIILNL